MALYNINRAAQHGHSVFTKLSVILTLQIVLY